MVYKHIPFGSKTVQTPKKVDRPDCGRRIEVETGRAMNNPKENLRRIWTQDVTVQDETLHVIDNLQRRKPKVVMTLGGGVNILTPGSDHLRSRSFKSQQCSNA